MIQILKTNLTTNEITDVTPEYGFETIKEAQLWLSIECIHYIHKHNCTAFVRTDMNSFMASLSENGKIIVYKYIISE